MHELITRIITGSFLITGIYFLITINNPCFFSITLGIATCIILSVEWPKLAEKNFWLWLLPPLYPVIPIVTLIYLNHRNHNLILPILLFSACFDSAAYLFGKRYGKNLIAPNISPKKSWEGFLGGLILVYCSIAALQFYYCTSIALVNSFILALAISIAATMGDLFESLLKRKAHVKDSGSLLPGHGGLLDRLDSILFVTILFFIFQKPITKFFCFS